MPTAKVLIIEDDENLRTVLADNLEDEGYEVYTASTVAAARETVAATPPDLVILDIMLPDGDGYRLCEEIRSAGYGGMVLMLTARSLDDDLVRGLDAGADDYLKKPYRLAELLARVRALLRRSGTIAAGGNEAPLRLGGFAIETVARRVVDERGAEIGLTPKEYELLMLLLDRTGVALHRQDILDAVWGADVVVDARTVDNFVSSLKKKLRWDEAASWRIATVRGVGYRFER